MNSIADDTRSHGRVAPSKSTAPSANLGALRTQARRLAVWWSADPQSTTFRGAIERDRGLLRRVDGR